MPPCGNTSNTIRHLHMLLSALISSGAHVFSNTHTLAQKNFEILFHVDFQAQSLQLWLLWYLLSLPGFGIEFESDLPCVK